MLAERIESARARYALRSAHSIAPWVAPVARPVLCFSDTHFVPENTGWNDDAPEDLHALALALREHELWSLGDLCEWVGLAPSQRARMFDSPRLAPWWSTLRARATRIIVGNHDYGAREALIAQFGGERVFDGGFELGAMRVRHGHEGHERATQIVGMVGPWVVPLYERARRWAARGPERLSNARVLHGLRDRGPCALFGHTHAMGGDAGDPAGAWFNPGCFLRSAQSFAVIDGAQIALYQRVT